jgi:hypothetical protein
MDGWAVGYIYNFTGIIHDREGTIYNGIVIINGERRANVCWGE